MVDSPAESYAVSLCDVSKSNRTLEKTSADLEKIEKVFTEESVFDFFANPIMSDEKKREVVAEIAKSFELQLHVVNFLNILVDMDRMELIKDIMQEFEMVYNKITDSRVGEDDQGSCTVDSWTQRCRKFTSETRNETLLDSSLVMIIQKGGLPELRWCSSAVESPEKSLLFCAKVPTDKLLIIKEKDG
nr:ATP synthase delta chain, chloroplastic [Ipomoea batatas]